MIRYLWWCLFPTVNIRVFYRAGIYENDSMMGSKGFRIVSQTAFNSCTEVEQDFLVWRYPVFSFYLDGKDGAR